MITGGARSGSADAGAVSRRANSSANCIALARDRGWDFTTSATVEDARRNCAHWSALFARTHRKELWLFNVVRQSVHHTVRVATTSKQLDEIGTLPPGVQLPGGARQFRFHQGFGAFRCFEHLILGSHPV